jgi:hypothetical protein
MSWHEHIVATPDTLHGWPRFRGTRIPVSVVLVKLDENVPDSVAGILRQAGDDVALARDQDLVGGSVN